MTTADRKMPDEQAATLAADRAHQTALMTCICGKRKASAFLAFCDACWRVLPWSLRGSLVRTQPSSDGGRSARRAAEEFIRAQTRA